MQLSVAVAVASGKAYEVNASDFMVALLSFSSDIHRLVPLHSAFRFAMLNEEHCQMTDATKPVRCPLHSADTSFATQANKKLIATFTNLEIESTHSQQRTSHFSNRNKNGLSGNSDFARASAFDLGLLRPLASSRHPIPPMESTKHVIVGTAGHIDHGKSTLVEALTGTNPDRLEEEKRRGITIDLGFAFLDLEGARLGFVDVPGHERFVRNMLAGVGGIDLVLLVIAADESIKPQTREHFDICRLLSVRRGITVLTKFDLVDRETLDVVRLEVEEFLRGSFLDNSPIVPVSSLTGAGLDELKQALAKVAAEIPAKDSTALARLPIDRVFSMKGFGTVVTGTLVSGTIRKDEELEAFPTGKRVRVRGVQVHGQSAEHALAGQRTALNLAGVTTEELARGMVLAPLSTFHSTFRLDVKLSLLPSTKPLKDRARVHLHAYTSETIAEVVLYGLKQVAPSGEAFAQLRLAEPVLLLPGDRFILRQFSPVVTIGGGVVLDAAPLVHKRPVTEVVSFLKTMATGSPEEVLTARVARRGETGFRLTDVPAEMNLPAGRAMKLAAHLAELGILVCCHQLLLSQAALTHAKTVIADTARKFHDANPLVSGIGKEELREKTNLGP